MRIETVTYEYEHCSECPHVLDYFDTGKKGWRCELKRRIIKEIWGEIPEWCPLDEAPTVREK